jgi:hypothetical protein
VRDEAFAHKRVTLRDSGEQLGRDAAASGLRVIAIARQDGRGLHDRVQRGLGGQILPAAAHIYKRHGQCTKRGCLCSDLRLPATPRRPRLHLQHLRAVVCAARHACAMRHACAVSVATPVTRWHACTVPGHTRRHACLACVRYHPTKAQGDPGAVKVQCQHRRWGAGQQGRTASVRLRTLSRSLMAPREIIMDLVRAVGATAQRMEATR